MCHLLPWPGVLKVLLAGVLSPEWLPCGTLVVLAQPGVSTTLPPPSVLCGERAGSPQSTWGWGEAWRASDLQS